METVKSVIYEMLEDRKYVIDKDSNKNDNTVILATKPNREQMIVINEIVPSLKIDEFNQKIALLRKYRVKHCIIIIDNQPSNHVENCIKNYAIQDVIIELFNRIELVINITKHRIVPKHEFYKKLSDCTPSEKKMFANEPVLLAKDPISKYYRFVSGDIILIYRNNNTKALRIVK